MLRSIPLWLLGFLHRVNQAYQFFCRMRERNVVVLPLGPFLGKVIGNVEVVWKIGGVMLTVAAVVALISILETWLSNVAVPVNKAGELAGKAVELKKPEENPASAAEPPATTPCEKEREIAPQSATLSKEYIERRKKQLIEKKSSGEETTTG